MWTFRVLLYSFSTLGWDFFSDTWGCFVLELSVDFLPGDLFNSSSKTCERKYCPSSLFSLIKFYNQISADPDESIQTLFISLSELLECIQQHTRCWQIRYSIQLPFNARRKKACMVSWYCKSWSYSTSTSQSIIRMEAHIMYEWAYSCLSVVDTTSYQ